MLQVRSNFEWCAKDLPPDPAEAMICSHECTHCMRCVETVLHNVCATCGGGFAPRPIRPQKAHRAGLSLGLTHQPASTARKHGRWSRAEVDALSRTLRDVPPDRR